MARKFAELQAKMSPQARARSDALYEQLVAEMPLHELRQARELSQVKLAQALNVNQAAVSKMEHRTDMYISTLRDYIRAMGGDLDIVARFPDGDVKITNFADQGDVRQPTCLGPITGRTIGCGSHRAFQCRVQFSLMTATLRTPRWRAASASPGRFCRVTARSAAR